MKRLSVISAFIAVISIIPFNSGLRASGQTIPAEAQNHMDRGFVAAEAASTDGDYQDAIREFQQAASLAPDWPDPYFNIGKLQEKLGQTDDALASYQRYLVLARNAPDADDVRKLVVKLQVQADKEAKLKRVYDMLTSPAYGRKTISSKTPSPFGFPMKRMGVVNGQVVAYNELKNEINIPDIKRSWPDWFPVTINGRLYEYKFTYYNCDLSGSNALGAPPYCPYEIVVKGEIISFDPPTVKEVTTTTTDWTSQGSQTRVNEFVFELVPK